VTACERVGLGGVPGQSERLEAFLGLLDAFGVVVQDSECAEGERLEVGAWLQVVGGFLFDSPLVA